MRESAGVDPQDFGIAFVGGANGKAELAGIVEHPSGDALGVLPHELALAGRDCYAIEIVPGLVAIVDPNVHDVRIVLRNIVDGGADSLGLSQIARGRNLLSRRRGGSRIDGVDVEVLVPALVLDEQDVLPVPAPEILGDRPLDVVRYKLRRRVWIAGALHPNVAGILVGFEEGDVAPVGRYLGAGDLRVTEEQLAVDERRDLAGLGSGSEWRAEADGERDRPAIDEQPHVFL